MAAAKLSWYSTLRARNHRQHIDGLQAERADPAEQAEVSTAPETPVRRPCRRLRRGAGTAAVPDIRTRTAPTVCSQSEQLEIAALQEHPAHISRGTERKRRLQMIEQPGQGLFGSIRASLNMSSLPLWLLGIRDRCQGALIT